MGPIELVFFSLFVVFGFVGVIRGYGRELGVTTMLFLALFVLEFVRQQPRYLAMLNKVIGIVGTTSKQIDTDRALLYCVLLIIVVFISYEGETLSFAGKRGNLLFDLGTGLLNGYLFAGSVWYYLDSAHWPMIAVSTPYSPAYETIVRFLPPAVFGWQYLVGLAIVLLIARVWK